MFKSLFDSIMVPVYKSLSGKHLALLKLLTYSETSEIQTPQDHVKMSAVERCILYRECTR